jgi:hypothetical protein
LRGSLYTLAFLRGDNALMEQQVAWAAGKPGDEDPMLANAPLDRSGVVRRNLNDGREF